MRTLQPEKYSISSEMDAGGGDLALVKPLQKRHRPSRRHWPKLAKALVYAFADRCKEGKTVRKKLFERTAKALFVQLYPDDPTVFAVSPGWFNRFLSRNDIAIRIITNIAVRSFSDFFASIGGTLSTTGRMEDTVMQTVIAIFLRIFSTWTRHCEYLEGKSYDFKGSKTSRSGGINDKQRYSADGIDRVKPLVISRGPKTTPPPHGNKKKNYSTLEW